MHFLTILVIALVVPAMLADGSPALIIDGIKYIGRYSASQPGVSSPLSSQLSIISKVERAISVPSSTPLQVATG
jgi:hypothetical protein